MNPINSILVIVDPTAERHPAVEKSALLAQKLGARLELYVCDTKASREVRLAAHARKKTDQPFLANLKMFLEELAKPIRQRGLDVTTGDRVCRPVARGIGRSCATDDSWPDSQGHTSSLAWQAHFHDEHGLGAHPRLFGAAAADQGEFLGELAESVRGSRSGACERQIGRTRQPHRGLRRARDEEARRRTAPAAHLLACGDRRNGSDGESADGDRSLGGRSGCARRRKSSRCCRTWSGSTESRRVTFTWRWAGPRQSCRARRAN